MREAWRPSQSSGRQVSVYVLRYSRGMIAANGRLTRGEREREEGHGRSFRLDDHGPGLPHPRSCAAVPAAPLLFLHGGGGCRNLAALHGAAGGDVRRDRPGASRLSASRKRRHGSTPSPTWRTSISIFSSNSISTGSIWSAVAGRLDRRGTRGAQCQPPRLADARIGAAGIHVKDVPQVDTFLSTEEQRIRDLFHDQKLAEAVVARARAAGDARTPRSRTGP